jgi:hypothetical protein
MPPQAPRATRSAQFVRLVVTLAVVLTGTAPGAGCARLGFSEQASVARDGGLDGARDGALDGPGDSGADAPDGDASSVDATLAGLNEPCSPGGCIPGLVCTGTPGNLHCRKGCGDGGCPDSEVCGRPVGVTTVPMACLANKTAGQHEDCSVLPCSAGLYCLKGNGGAACFKGCTSSADCGANESCATEPLKHCMPRCKIDADCPNSLFRCVGVGPYPYDHCAPLIPVGPHAVCTAKIYCGPGYRCTGQANQTKHCYKTCPANAGGTCLTNELCYKNLSGVEFCLRSCDPLDSPIKCRSTETCYADPDLAKAYCIPAKGDATNCTNTVPCITGKICIQGSCKPACDSTHPCKTGTCSTLNAGGKTMPWKACN